MLAEVDATDALSRVLAAFESLGYPRAVVEQWSIPAADAADLVAELRATSARLPGSQPLRILEVGTFVGTSALLMLLALPGCEVHTVDPNLPLDVEFAAMNCGERGANLARRTHEVAALAAERLGVRDRLHLHQGGFSTEATFAGRSATVPAIGSAVIDAVLDAGGPFDAAFIDGLHFEQAVLSDLVLAARGLHADAPIILHDAIGYWGAPVRRAVSRFLEQSPGYSFSHPPYAALYRSIAVLSRAPRLEDQEYDTRARTAFGSAADRLPGLLARALATQLPAHTLHACDAPSCAVVAAAGVDSGLDSGAVSGADSGGVPGTNSGADARADVQSAATPRSTPVRIGIALDTLDAVAAADLDATLAALVQNHDALLLGLTPPGESGAARPHSRPLAPTVAALDRLGFDAFDAIVPFLEPFSYPLGAHCVLPTRTSFLATSVLAARRGTAVHAHLCAHALDPISPGAARAIESARTQRTHDRASLARFRAEHAELNDRARALSLQAESSRDTRHAALLAEIDSLRARLQHMLDWRVHVGRHHFWRRTDARI